jgi:hypothetical protein
MVSIIILWHHCRICGPSLTETSLCGVHLYLHLRTFKLLVHVIVSTPLHWFSFSFYKLIWLFNVSILWILYPWWWPHGWPKHVVFHCMYKKEFWCTCVHLLVPLLYKSCVFGQYLQGCQYLSLQFCAYTNFVMFFYIYGFSCKESEGFGLPPGPEHRKSDLVTSVGNFF